MITTKFLGAPAKRRVVVDRQSTLAGARREAPASAPPIQEANSLLQSIFASRDSMIRKVMTASSDAAEARALATAQRGVARQAVASAPKTTAPVQPVAAAKKIPAVVAVRPRYVPSIYGTNTTVVVASDPENVDPSEEKK